MRNGFGLFARSKAAIRNRLIDFLAPFVQEICNRRISVWGDPGRLKIHPNAYMVNTLFNTVSGSIEIGEFSFSGHNVSILTGTHDYETFMEHRMNEVPSSGRDIVVGKGVWIGSNAVILGPCTIDDHAVVAAGAVVLPGTRIESCEVFGGVPARLIRRIGPFNSLGHDSK